MLQLSNGVIFPGFIIYLILYIIMRLMPDSFVRFQILCFSMDYTNCSSHLSNFSIQLSEYLFCF